MLVLLLCLGCSAPSKVEEQVTLIQVKGKHGFVEMSDFVERNDTLRLNPSLNLITTSVQDICLDDSVVFILDDAKSIFSFDVHSGKMLHRLHSVGRSRNEYFLPKAMDVDINNLFVLDFQGRKVLKYTKDLEYISSFSLGFAALDFTIVADGFLFFNMSASEKYRRIVHTDFEGRVIDGFLQEKGIIKTLVNDKFFCSDGAGNVYYSDLQSNDVYQWQDGTLKKVYSLDFAGVNNVSENGIMYGNMIVGDHVVTQFLSDKIVMSNIYDPFKQNSMTGAVATRTKYPFLPQAIHSGNLYGVYEANGQNGYTLVRYKLK